MKTLLINLSLVLISLAAQAQETIEVINKLDRKNAEVYNVLKTDMKTREGLYQVRYNKTIALASGIYHNNVRKGVWHFFDQAGKVMQNFDYDRNLLTYEAPDTRVDFFKYALDKPYTAKDTATRPIKIGGKYMGYQTLLRMFKKPADVNTDDNLRVQIELLISPFGNLADYTIQVDGLKLNVNLDLLPDEEKKFIPATINGEPVASTITFPCIMKSNGNLLLFSDVEWKKDHSYN